MEEDIKILEEIVDIYYDCAGNKEQDYDMRVDMGFMKKEAQALENLIKGYRELEESKITYERVRDIQEENKKIVDEKYIPKSKIVEIYRKIEKKTRDLFNSTYIPMNERIYNDNRERYEPMLKGREIAIECLKSLQELMEDK